MITALTLGPCRAPSSQRAHPVAEAAHKGARRFEKRLVKRGVTDGGMTERVNGGPGVPVSL